MTPEQQKFADRLHSNFALPDDPQITQELKSACFIDRDFDAIISASSTNRVKLEASSMIPVLEELLTEEDRSRIISKLNVLSEPAKDELIKFLSLRAMFLLSQKVNEK